MRSVLLAAALAASFCFPAFAQEDPRQWLEGVEDPAALAWVAKQNAASTAALQGDPRYAKLHAQALAVLSAQDRVAEPDFIGAAVFDFWQDADHVRGVWRRTTLAAYRRGEPNWETVLDLDALTRAEQVDWVWKGATCRAPAYDRCMVELSDGGADATEAREFDLRTREFVAGGFRLPQGKQTIQWLDPDTLILNRDWGPGTTTESGYGFVVKTLKRGQPLEAAVEVFRGGPSDVSAYPEVFRDGLGRQATLIVQATDFFHNAFYSLGASGPVRLDLPAKAEVHGFVDAELIVSLGQDWAYQDAAPTPAQHFKSGSLVGVTVAAVTPRGPQWDNFMPADLIFEPDERTALDADQVETTANRVVAVVYDNVRGRVLSFGGGRRGWTRARLPAPENATVQIAAASDVGDEVFYTTEGFLTPPELVLADAASGKARTVDTQAPAFNAAGLVVEQHEAVSKDGTRVPYFLVRRKGAPLNGSLPTLLHGYGGFQIAETPEYDPVLGKLWLGRGGAYALANIRGGGEFGPAWHEAAMNARRQNAYDDFAAVAEDLIARQVTSPRRLGIYGRSNGGLLMGVAMTQHPELYNAVVIESPLLDMLRYHELPAGASWIGEYGDPRIPEEAAWISAYSPYQALKPGVDYPLAYITTNTRDDRVHPGHARKFAAKLADLGVPYLYYEDTEGGHANAADPKANARRWAMHYVYLMRRLMD